MRSPKPCCRNEAASWKPAWPAPTIRTGPRAISSGRHDAKRQGVEPAQRVVPPELPLARQFERPHAPRKRAENRLAFEPGHRLPDAAMNAGAEGHVAGGAAPDVERIGLVPAARVAVGRGKKQEHLFAVAHSHAGDLDVFGCGAEEGLHRRL